MPYTPGAVRYASAPILSYTKGEPKKAMTYFRVPLSQLQECEICSGDASGSTLHVIMDCWPCILLTWYTCAGYLNADMLRACAYGNFLPS